MQLSEDRQTCTTDTGQELKVGQTIDYKGAAELKTSLGKISQFKYAGHQQSDKESIWMKVTEIGVEKGGESEWVSVAVWTEQIREGLFGQKIAPVTSDGPVSEEDDLPF